MDQPKFRVGDVVKRRYLDTIEIIEKNNIDQYNSIFMLKSFVFATKEDIISCIDNQKKDHERIMNRLNLALEFVTKGR